MCLFLYLYEGSEPFYFYDPCPAAMTTRQRASARARAYRNVSAGGKSWQVNGDITNINIWPLAREYQSHGQCSLAQSLLTHCPFVAALETRPGPLIPKTTVFSVSPKPVFFQGRDHDLEEIRCRLSPDGQQSSPELRSCLITAMGGMGKTRIALEYAHRNRTLYDCIFWLEAQQLPKLAMCFASIATQLGLPHAESMGGSGKYEVVKEWLETTSKTPKDEVL